MKLKADGFRVGVLDLTDGEPTPFGTVEIRARETAAASAVLGLDWRENLGLPNRSVEATLGARAKLATVFRREKPRWLFAPLLGRLSSRPCRGHATDRGGPLLVEAHEVGHARRTASSGANFLLLLRPPASRRATGVRARHQPVLGTQTPSGGMLSKPIRHRPPTDAADVHRPAARSGGLLGLVHWQAVWRGVCKSRADRRGELEPVRLENLLADFGFPFTGRYVNRFARIADQVRRTARDVWIRARTERPSREQHCYRLAIVLLLGSLLIAAPRFAIGGLPPRQIGRASCC